jgi:hypothetical protein
MIDPYEPIVVDLSKLKLPIYNVDPITIYGQLAQDLFVIAMTKGKQNGTYLEIGCGWPIGGGNNTFALQEYFNWSGVSIDSGRDAENSDAWRSLDEDWQAFRPFANFLNKDAFSIDYSLYPTHFDYLQVDIDPSSNSFAILKKITEHIKFSVITFEHDWLDEKSNHNDFKIRSQSRQYLESLGYVLIISDIGGEDWWVDPSIITEDVINAYTQTNVVDTRTHCLLNINQSL